MCHMDSMPFLKFNHKIITLNMDGAVKYHQNNGTVDKQIIF